MRFRVYMRCEREGEGRRVAHAGWSDTTTLGGWHPGRMFIDHYRGDGLRWYTGAPGSRFCVGRIRRGKYLWSMVRAKVFRESLMWYWMRVTAERGCAKGGRIRKRDRDRFESGEWAI